MAERSDAATEAAFIDTPHDPDLRALHEYWDGLRGDRAMPSRQDIDPTAIPKLLPYVFMYNVVADGGGYSIRLAGEEVVRLVGHTGRPAGSTMTPLGSATLITVLDAVTAERVPKFRAGKAFWHPDRMHQDYEGCFLPLSSDGKTVNIVLGGVKFPGLIARASELERPGI
jgi:hypothetical protein